MNSISRIATYQPQVYNPSERRILKFAIALIFGACTLAAVEHSGALGTVTDAHTKVLLAFSFLLIFALAARRARAQAPETTVPASPPLKSSPTSITCLEEAWVVSFSPKTDANAPLLTFASDEKDLESEFTTLPAPDRKKSVESKKYTTSDEQTKNRYFDILPYDDYTFKMPLEKDRKTYPYINATLLPTNDVIAQGPLPNTIEDFWAMIWAHKIKGIVMVTDFEEAGRSKSAEYFNAKGEFKVGAFKVETICQEMIQLNNLNTLIVSDLKLTHNGKFSLLTHIHEPKWPDHKPYPDAGSLRKIMHKTNAINGPLLVHCSAGVGRSGTFYACYLIDLVARHCRMTGQVALIDLHSLVSYLRTYRPSLVYYLEQYKNVYSYAQTLNSAD